jgi:hypothetical protein
MENAVNPRLLVAERDILEAEMSVVATTRHTEKSFGGRTIARATVGR